MRNGHTLLELLAGLTLAGLLLTPGLTLFLAARDRVAVAAVREEIASLLSRTRSEARLHGGARLLLLPDPLTLHLLVGEDTLVTSEPGARLGVALAPRPGGGGPLPFTFEYDGMGIGRMASGTIRLERGRALGQLTVSALGRVVR